MGARAIAWMLPVLLALPAGGRPERTARAPQDGGRAPGAQEPAPAFVGRAFVFRVDLETGRALGWLDPGVSDEHALEAVRHTLLARLRGAGRFAEATVELEPGGRVAVTFVGDQPAEVQAYLVQGLALPARLEVRVVASAGDLEALGTTEAAERARLAAWREEQSGSTPGGDGKARFPLEGFRRQDARAGGVGDGLEWVAEDGAEGGATLLLAGPAWPVERARTEAGLRPDPAASPTPGLCLTLAAAAHEELRAWADRQAPRALVLTLDGRALGRLERPLGERLSLGASFTATEARALVFALAGEPLPAPLHLEERTTRPLEGVRAR